MAAAIRVLYVDDEPDLLELGKMFLERSGDFSITTNDSATAALELLGTEQFNAIISDYHMPGMDGIQFLLEVRKRFGQVPFILFTGRGREEIVIKAINSGADLYLQKGGEISAQFAELAHKTRIVVERHATIAALKESEEKNRRIVETSHEGIWAMDKDFVTTYVNERMAKMLGCNADEMLGKSILSFVPEEDLADQNEKLRQRYEGKPGTYERRFRDKDGKTRIFNVSATPVTGDDGSFRGSFAMLTDITDRKDAELALHETNEYLNNLFDYANAPIIVWDTEFRITRFNHAFEHLIGRKGQEVVGQSLGILFSETNRAASLELIRKTLAGERWEVVEIPVHHVSGESRTVLWNSANIVDFGGTIISTIAQGQDITDRKEAELALQKAHNNLEVQVQERTADLYSANMKLQKEIEHSNVIAESLKEYSKMTSTLNEVIITANKAETLPNLFRDSLDRALELLDFEAGGIYLVNPEERIAEVYYSKNLPEDFIEKTRAIPIDAPPYDTLFIRGQSIITEHFEEFSPELAEISQIRSLASIPLVSKNSVIGALNVANTKRSTLSADEIQVLTAIGRELGTTIARMIAEEEVKTVSVNLQTLFASINEMVFVLDMEGRIISANDSVIKRLHYTNEELTGMNVLLLHVPERRDEALRNVQGMIAGTIESCPVPLISKDGTRTEVETTVTHGLWNNQEVLIGVTRDVTDRKLAEDALRQLSDRLSLATRPGGVGTWDYDVVHNLLTWDDQMFALYGITRQQFGGAYEAWQAGVHPEDRQRGDAEIQMALCGEKEFDTEFRVLWPNGSIRTIRALAIVQCDAKGTPLRMIGTNWDITAEKNAEEVLRGNDEKIHLLLNSAAEGIYGLNMDGNCTFCNNSCLRLLGYRDADELLGRNMHWQIHAKYPDGTHFPVEECRIFKAFNKGEGTHVDDEVLWRNDGTSFPAEYWSYPQRHDGEVVGAVVTFLDITDRKEREREMKYHEQELMRISSSLAAVNKKLALLSHITRHDINNQLEVLLGYLSLLKYRKLDPTLDEYFQKITTATERIAVMIRFTREYGSIGVNTPAWQDCRTLVDMAAKQAPLGQVVVNNEIPGSAEVFADPLIVKVFYNLMDNAVRYGGKCTTIRFSVEETGDDHLVVCEDGGIGVPAEEKEKIFERGFGKNTGLGLALSREILDITGITIIETGEPGKGARFEMVVPKGAWRITGDGA